MRTTDNTSFRFQVLKKKWVLKNCLNGITGILAIL
jgi:hypothetical protein